MSHNAAIAGLAVAVSPSGVPYLYSGDDLEVPATLAPAVEKRIEAAFQAEQRKNIKHEADEQIDWVREMVDAETVYHPRAWTAKQARRFLHNIPQLEEAGLLVRVPDWWKANKPTRPTVKVEIGEKDKRGLCGAASGKRKTCSFTSSFAVVQSRRRLTNSLIAKSRLPKRSSKAAANSYSPK